jgi:hypothetical protein
LTQSAESLEKKEVEFLMSAKECKRVRKNVNTKGIARNEEHRLAGLKAEAPSPCFRNDMIREGLVGGVCKRYDSMRLKIKKAGS